MSAVMNPPLPAVGFPPLPMPPNPPGPRLFRWTQEEFMRVHSLLTCEGKKVQLIRGEIWEFGPMNPPHAAGITKCRRQLERALPAGLDVRVQLPTDVTPDTMPLPDLTVVPLRADDYSTAHPTARETLLVVEVASTSLQYDLTQKAELYAVAGIPEYWVLDVENRILHLLRDPGTVAANGTAYRSQQQFGPDDAVSPLAAPDRTVKVADLLP
jgi:Uma2 family endonuclease